MPADTPPPSTTASELTGDAAYLDEAIKIAEESNSATGRHAIVMRIDVARRLLSRLSAGEGDDQQSVAESASATREDAGTASIIIGADFKAPDSAADLLSDISLTLTAIEESRLAPTRSQACDLFQRARDELVRLTMQRNNHAWQEDEQCKRAEQAEAKLAEERQVVLIATGALEQAQKDVKGLEAKLAEAGRDAARYQTVLRYARAYNGEWCDWALLMDQPHDNESVRLLFTAAIDGALAADPSRSG